MHIRFIRLLVSSSISISFSFSSLLSQRSISFRQISAPFKTQLTINNTFHRTKFYFSKKSDMKKFLIGATKSTSDIALTSTTIIQSQANGELEKTQSKSVKDVRVSTDAVTAPPQEHGVAAESSKVDLPINPSSVSKDLSSHFSCSSGEPVPYSVVVNTFEEVSRVSGRLDKEAMLTRLFTSVILTSPQDLEYIVYLASNHVSPVYDGLELGIGDSLLVKAICESTGRKKDAVEEAFQKEGDLGVVAVASRASQKTLGFTAQPKPLMARYVLEQFRAITLIKGDKAQARKIDVIKTMMVRCIGQEAKYIVRALQGKLRIGTAEQTVLVSLAHALVDVQEHLFPPNAAQGGALIVEESINTLPSHPDKQSELDNDNEALEDILARIIDVKTPEGVKLERHYSGEKLLSKEILYELSEIAVKRAFSQCPNLTLLVAAGLSHPIYQLHEHCKLRIGVPVAPMLAKPTKEIGEVLKRLSGQAFTMEYKYDGERAQVHLLPDGSVRIFSRNSEDNTEKYPDLRDVVRTARVAGVQSCIIDAEVVAYDREKGCLLPFQVLSTRKRKVESGEEDNQKVKVILQLFDLLYLNEKSLLSQSLRTRRRLLKKAFVHTESLLHLASGMDHIEDGDTAPIETFLTEACNAMCEGLMVKTLDENATYEPSKRSLNWLKLKKDYINGMGVCDSVDLVPIGGYYGKGKRVNTFGAYLVACYDPDRDEYQSVCKVGTGFKDEDLLRLSEQLREKSIPSKKKPMNYNVGEALYPDEWFEASNIVWEVQAADLSRSSVHRGGVGRIENDGIAGIRGIGLRFPRYLRDRPDKKAELATTSEQIVDLFLSQSNGAEGGAGKINADDDDDDFI